MRAWVKKLIKSRFDTLHRHKDSFLHTSELQDGQDWTTNLSSVTEQTDLDEFLATAQMAGRDFTAEKQSIEIVNPQQYTGILGHDEEVALRQRHLQNKDMLKIPRKPSWTVDMSAEEVDRRERESFLEWRRDLAKLEESEGLMLTPYERNLEFWRQLWRVIERSDMVVQIVDARNPLLFWCTDLQRYVRQVDPHKRCMMLVNKADLLNQTQRDMWADYFNKQNIRVAFWSALAEEEATKEALKAAAGSDDEDDDLHESSSEDVEEDKQPLDNRLKQLSISESEGAETGTVDSVKTVAQSDSDPIRPQQPIDASQAGISADAAQEIPDSSASQVDASCPETEVTCSSSELLTGEQLIELLSTCHNGPKRARNGKTTIGMVGYPNVGKSSTINALLQLKKVPVSATPGRTKHFQTLELNELLTLCDCPGLVMPTFVATKAEMVVSGILPVHQMRDHIGPCSLICQQLYRERLEQAYNINIPAPGEGEDPTRPPSALEMLSAYAYMRGYMGRGGQPDCPRSARYVVKDYITGKLLYCHPPPGADLLRFVPAPESMATATRGEAASIARERHRPAQKSSLDAEFFKVTRPVRFGEKGVSVQSETDFKKHNKRHKKEKLRRLNRDLDA